MNVAETLVIEHCPLCGSTTAVEDSIPEPNLYSEKLAELLGEDEPLILREHANWRCSNCGLVYKRRWFATSVVRELFRGPVASHPKGWDVVLGRFSARGFRESLDRWCIAIGRGAQADIRRGERELLSIVDSIQRPVGFAPSAVAAAIAGGDVAAMSGLAPAITASIGEPAPFKRFSGFRSRALWAYLEEKVGGVAEYAELGCPLWGLLSLAAEQGSRATYLRRDEPNYWGPGCVSDGMSCLDRLLGDRRIGAASWSSSGRHAVIGLFQYLDHLTAPRPFLEELFAKTDSAAIIMDGVGAPVAIQHVTGWTEASFVYVARRFGKRLHADFTDIRASGNHLFVLTPDR